MGLNQTREVKTTYVCDFCKHQEVTISEYGNDTILPKGWSAMAVVPADQKPRAEVVPKYTMFSSAEPNRYCLSSDREVNLAIACQACSVYGLQAIKNAKPEQSAIKYAFKLTSTVFYVLVASLLSLGALLGFLIGPLLRR